MVQQSCILLCLAIKNHAVMYVSLAQKKGCTQNHFPMQSFKRGKVETSCQVDGMPLATLVLSANIVTAMAQLSSMIVQEQLKRSPLQEMPGGRGKLLAEKENAKMRSSHNSTEFMKMYSPMADKMAEAARNSNNGGYLACASISLHASK